MSFGSADDSRHHITHIKTRETSMSLSVLSKFALLRSLRSCPLDQEFIGFVILGRPRNCATLMIIGVSPRVERASFSFVCERLQLSVDFVFCFQETFEPTSTASEDSHP